MKKHITLLTFMMMVIILLIVKRISVLAYDQPGPLKTNPMVTCSINYANAIDSAHPVSGDACRHESLFIREQKSKRHACNH